MDSLERGYLPEERRRRLEDEAPAARECGDFAKSEKLWRKALELARQGDDEFGSQSISEAAFAGSNIVVAAGKLVSFDITQSVGA